MATGEQTTDILTIIILKKNVIHKIKKKEKKGKNPNKLKTKANKNDKR
jgi:hypothetical protein